MGGEEQPFTNIHLKHILRMDKHDFCGEQSIYTRAILENKKICMHVFFVGGGGTENLCGGGGGVWARAPQAPPPRSYAPDFQTLGRFFCVYNITLKISICIWDLTFLWLDKGGIVYMCIILPVLRIYYDYFISHKMY